MREIGKMWRQQCDGARRVKEGFGVPIALGYLVGEKLAAFMRAETRDRAVAAELPQFVGEIKAIFRPSEIREYLENVRRRGPMTRVCGEGTYRTRMKGRWFSQTRAERAEEILLIERMKKLLL